MTEIFRRLYKSMIEELQKELASANNAYTALAEQVALSFHNGSELTQEEFDRLAGEFHQILIKLLNHLNLLYPGQVQIFPLPENAGLLETMEVFNRQLEAVETALEKLSKNPAGAPANKPAAEPENESSPALPVAVKNNIPKVNILVCGKLNAGKTSLIQSVTHPGTVPDDDIEYKLEAEDTFRIYSTEIANFVEVELLPEDLENLSGFAATVLLRLHSKTTASGIDTFHAIWLCCDGSCGGSPDEQYRRLIGNGNMQTLNVITQLDLMNNEDVGSLMGSLLDLTDREKIVLTSSTDFTGLKNLVEKTRDIGAEMMALSGEELQDFQQAWQNYYQTMFKRWQDIVSDKANSYIHWAAGRAAAIALVPLPLADVAPLIANESYMIYKLAGVYGVAVDETVKTMLLGCAGGSIAGKLAASFLPFLKVPIAAGITYGVGKAAKAYFESNMTLNSYELKNAYLAGEQEAKKIEWKN